MNWMFSSVEDFRCWPILLVGHFHFRRFVLLSPFYTFGVRVVQLAIDRPLQESLTEKGSYK